MKCTIPEISWHNREPVLSVDVQPLSTEFYRLASGGGDTHVLIWMLNLCENGSVKQEVVSDLTRHQRAVNCVRWSPSGQFLASADDDGNILIWQQKNDNIPLLEGDSGDKETWIVFKVLRGHKEDVYDLCWSPDNLRLFSGSVDNTAILWDVQKGRIENILKDHKGFVQGVTWDPDNQILATISTDRLCRLFDVTGKQVIARIHKGKLPLPPNHFLADKEVKYFHDDTFRSFFRRLQFSPDGSLLIVPSGHAEADDCKKILNATLIFLLDNLSEPVAVLPVLKQSSTVIRFCPLLFQLHEDGPEPVFKLPYRMIFAVGTDHDVILYDTQQLVPFARFQDIHYTRLTDLTWSKNGQLLIASSTDGFCSLITFEPKELGEIYVEEEREVEDSIMDVSVSVEIENEAIDPNALAEKEETKKKSSFIEKWAQSGPILSKKTKDKEGSCSNESSTITSPRKKLSLLESFCKVNKKSDENSSDDDCIIISSPKKSYNQTENNTVKKRVPLITLSSPGKKKMVQDRHKESKVDIPVSSNNDNINENVEKHSPVLTGDCRKETTEVNKLEESICKNEVKIESKYNNLSCEIKENICRSEIREVNTDETAVPNQAVKPSPQVTVSQTVVKKRVALITLSPAKKTLGKKEANTEITKDRSTAVGNKVVNMQCVEKKVKKRVPLITLSNTSSMNKSKVQDKTETRTTEKYPVPDTETQVEKKRVPLPTISTTVEKKIDTDEDYDVIELKKKCMRTVLRVNLTRDNIDKPKTVDLKRKPSFLERWATSTPAKRKTPAVKVKEEGDVIEILDD